MKPIVYKIFDPSVRDFLPLSKHRFIGPLFYAIIVDAVDLFSTAIVAAFPFLTIFHIGIDVIADIIQISIALLVFKDPFFALTNADILLPPVLDLFPSYTAKVIVRELGWL